MKQIHIRGLRESGWRGEDVEIPLGCVVGLRGGNRARSLAYRVLLGESRRRYLLSMSPFERERIGGVGTRAAIDSVEGLPPAQDLPASEGGSDVASRLHIASDVVRLLRSRVDVECAVCGGESRSFTEEQVIDWLGERYGEESVLLVAPIPVADPTSIPGMLQELERGGFRRIRVQQEVVRLTADVLPDLDTSAWSHVHVVVDRLSPARQTRSRIGEGVRTCRSLAGGRLLLVAESGETCTDSRRACTTCGVASQEPDWAAVARGNTREGLSLEGDSLIDLSQLCLKELANLASDSAESVAGRLRHVAQRSAALRIGHLPLWRAMADLSHGERLQVGIAAALATSLTGVLHVVTQPPSALDEATRNSVYGGLRELVRGGSSVVVLDDDVAGDAVDRLITVTDPGPSIDWPTRRDRASRPVTEVEQVTVAGPTEGDLPVPADALVLPVDGVSVVAGPSGSGKSALLRLLREGLPGKAEARRRVRAPAVKRVIDLTAPDGRDTDLLLEILGAHRPLARLLADTPVARDRNLGTDHFLREKTGGRCPACEGQGIVHHRLDLVEDIAVPCVRCEGRRFRDEVLQVTAHGVNIADILALTVAEAAAQFSREASVHKSLSAALSNGLASCRLDATRRELSAVERLLARITRHQMAGRRGDLVVADRPASGSDEATRAVVAHALRRLESAGTGVILTDGAGLWTRLADAVVELRLPVGRDSC